MICKSSIENLHNVDFKAGETILINKAYEWTSFNVVGKVRSIMKRITGEKKNKVGHAGTLDPLATGLVIICTGKKTKEIEKFQAKEKEYIAEVMFGATTPSFDLETEICQTFETDHINKELIEQTLETFVGKQEQTAPVYSAKWIDGKRAYNLARAGAEDIPIKKHEIEIHEIEYLKFKDLKLTIRVKCSKGTYIRSLANDIGKRLNSGAHLSGLIRTKIGEFNVEEALTTDEFEKLILG